MKVAIYFVVIICIFAAYVQAQRRMCPGEPRPQNCLINPHRGRAGPACTARAGERWYYQNGACRSMYYLGCGGNANRYCTLDDCKRKCRGLLPPE